MRFLDERRSRARLGISSPQRLRLALAFVLLALGTAFVCQRDAQDALVLATHLGLRAREAAEKDVLQKLNDYLAARKVTQPRSEHDAEALALVQQTHVLLERWEQDLGHEGILRHARVLAEEDHKKLSAARDRLAGAATLLLLALLTAQVEAARRTRRLVNPQLFLATVLAAWATLEPLHQLNTALNSFSPERAMSGAFAPPPWLLAPSILLVVGILATLGLRQRWQEFERG
ncbi:MAG: hypothetical protein RMJ98_03120 [Myxococcales bacterium]|nr:hypothetical protein [Polyangiaceae bacterium]MDW8248281.1 hypothetical protein [Myxococcales bacterium]